MSLYITSLNSGSNGNCYYIGDGTDAVLIDAGISCRETEKRMCRLGLSMKNVRALFITHEHSDHIRGVEGISKKHNLPVYITEATLKHSRLGIQKSLVYSFSAYEPVQIGKLKVSAFPKLHDAIDPHSFIIEGHGTTIGVFTDIGEACEHVTRNFASCDAAFLEANYDEYMLENGRYPIFLKNRIKSEKGHLSNDQALQLLLTHKSASLQHIFLSHLSKDNNSPEKALACFLQNANQTRIEVASRYVETSVYQIQRGKASQLIDLIASEAHVDRQQVLF
jgi:phosphoribosyl 1,2-cyclic phosphodiesterase